MADLFPGVSELDAVAGRIALRRVAVFSFDSPEVASAADALLRRLATDARSPGVVALVRALKSAGTGRFDDPPGQCVVLAGPRPPAGTPAALSGPVGC